MNNLIKASLLSVCVSAAIGSLALAQAPAPNTTAPAASSPAAKAGHRMFSRASPTERTEARLTKVKAELKITAAQQAHWDAYANVLRKTAQEREQARAAHKRGDPQPTAIERLERQQVRQAASAKQLDRLLAVERPLYVALSADQKKVADKMLNRRFGHRGHHGSSRA